jgi:hypothetical protein
VYLHVPRKTLILNVRYQLGPLMIDRYIRASDIGAAESWLMLESCLGFGASEFSLSEIWWEGTAAEPFERLYARLAEFRLDDARREHLTAPSQDQVVRSTALWRLTPETIGIIKELFPGGVFDYPASETASGWFEDPTFYREGVLTLGVVSHENEGVLCLTKAEHTALAELGIRTYESGVWI